MFSAQYPNLNWWIKNQGWIALGPNEYSDSLLRVIDAGGLCWEYKGSGSIDESLLAAEKWLSEEISNRFDERPPKEY